MNTLISSYLSVDIGRSQEQLSLLEEALLRHLMTQLIEAVDDQGLREGVIR